MALYQETFDRLEQFIEQKRRETNVPGIAIAVTNRERTLRVATYGYADIAARTPVTPDTLFEIGSIGKSFTSIVLLQLHDAGRLDLHAPVTRYLPWFRVQSGHAPITVHHLMSHTASIIMGTDFAPDSRYEVWALRDTETGSPPGEWFHYSNVGYKALGYLLEEVLGQTYGDIIQSRILDPLGMTATAPVFTHETRIRLAVGYQSLYDDRPGRVDDPLVPATWLEYGSGDGSIASTPADMATYLRMLLNRGQVQRGRVLSEQSFSLMMQRVIETDEEGRFYGYGLHTEARDGHTLIGHGGGMVGYVSMILGDMDDGLGAVVLSNGSADTFEIARFALSLLRAALHDQEPPPLPSVADRTKIENAADYVGMYKQDEKTLTLVAEDEQLILQYGGERVTLERRGPDRFYADHPDFARFLLIFRREDGRVVEAFHGSGWYITDRYSGPAVFDYPKIWEAYPGHYRSHNPWFSNFRVILRKGQLVMIFPWGDEQELAPLDDGSFRIGDNARSPGRIRFDAVANGRALRANASGCDYYLVFTP